MDVVAKMLDANKRLQSRLEDAEQKIKNQAEEIRNQQFEARTDALTRLANRRAFDAFLADSTQLFVSQEQPFSLIMFDVDNFKQFNDVHGHPAGDEVLRTVGRTLGRAVSTGDLACRYGGEEFAVILTQTNLADGQLAAERIRKAIEGMSVQFGGNVLRVTASVGVAGCMATEEPAVLVRRADEAVYGAKKNGRNCCFWHDGEIAHQYLAPKPIVPEQVVKAPTAPKSFPNCAVFTDELGRRIAESQRFGVPLTLVHFRVRDYSHLEHTYGNAVGTLLIDSLASFIQSTLRDMDLLARLEGGELVVMLPGSSSSAAKIVGQRVRTSISLCPVPLGDHQIRLELDMGVASVQPGEDARAAMETLAPISTRRPRSKPRNASRTPSSPLCESPSDRGKLPARWLTKREPLPPPPASAQGAAEAERLVAKAATVQLAVDAHCDDGVCGGRSHSERCRQRADLRADSFGRDVCGAGRARHTRVLLPRPSSDVLGRRAGGLVVCPLLRFAVWIRRRDGGWRAAAYVAFPSWRADSRRSGPAAIKQRRGRDRDPHGEL